MTTQRCFPLTEELANPRWRNINERCKVQDAEILALQDLVLELDAKVRELENESGKLLSDTAMMQTRIRDLEANERERITLMVDQDIKIAEQARKIEELLKVQAKLSDWCIISDDDFNAFWGCEPLTEEDVIKRARRECGLDQRA